MGRRCMPGSVLEATFHPEAGDPQELPEHGLHLFWAGISCTARLAEAWSCVSCTFLGFLVVCHGLRARHQQHGWLCMHTWCHLQEVLQLMDALLGF